MGVVAFWVKIMENLKLGIEQKFRHFEGEKFSFFDNFHGKVAFWVKNMARLELRTNPQWVGIKSTRNHTLLHVACYSYTLDAR